MTDIREWQGQVGASWAKEWRRTDRSFAPLTQRLLERIAKVQGARQIVDIGCGAGELSIRLAEAHPAAQILGLDVSPELIAAAAGRGNVMSNLSFSLADAATWHDESFVPDLYVSRHGVMFFDDPIAAFSHLASRANAGARMVFSCFRSPAENAWASKIAALLSSAPTADPHAPGPFAFADSARVQTILAGAGWRDISFEPVDFDFVTGGGDDPVGDAVEFYGQIGPAARAIRTLGDREREAFVRQLHELAEAHLCDGAVRFGAAAWIVTATKA